MTNLFQAFWIWVEANPGVAGAVGTFIALGLALLAHIFGFFRWLLGKLQGNPLDPRPVVVQQSGPIQPDSVGTITLTVETYEERLQERAKGVSEQIRTAAGAERERLAAEKTELESRLADIDIAYTDAKARIVELEATLARFGNEIGGDRLADARAALEAGDFSKADEIFGEVRVREAMAMERAAEAAFGQGQIAEEQVRWLAAAEHYGEAARLVPNFDRLNKAHQLAWRSGRYNEAARWANQLIAFAKQEYGEEAAETGLALNNLGTIYHQIGVRP